VKFTSLGVALVTLALVLAATPAQARQQAVRTDSATTAVAQPSIPTPGGVFLRSLLVPGWGHAAIGSYTRGGVYFAARVASGFMLFKTIARLAEARDVERRHTASVRDSLLVLAQTDTILARQLEKPGALDAAISAHPATKGFRDLVSSREQQREDWITWNLFWILISSADAFVAAHLADFPAQFSAERDGDAVQLQVRVPVPTLR